MKAITLISGGIDSPVATYLMMKKGVEVVALHLDNRPFTDEKQQNKTIEIVRYLSEISGRDIKTCIVPHGNTQGCFAKNCRRNMQCVLCRRMMFRTAREVAMIEDASCIITGESLGQVASQTLTNIYTTAEAVDISIIRPLIGLDKEEVIKIARRIGTYDLSILPGLCCTIVPKRPATAARLDEVHKEERKVNMDSLLKNAMEGLCVLSP